MIWYIVLTIAAIYFVLKYIYSYWERNDFPYIPPSIPFGNMNTVVKGKQQFGFRISDLYAKTKEPFVGIYLLFKPALMVCDINLANKILVEDFNSFHDRGIFSNKKIDPMAHSLLSAEGQEWRAMRQQFSPTFTSGKLKAMFSTITDVANRLDTYMESRAEVKAEIQLEDIASGYSTDIVASVIFGYDVDTINEPNHEFRKAGRLLTIPNGMDAVRLTLMFMCPE